MNFEIKKKEFVQALTIASRAISSFSPLPAFSGIKIEVNEDGIIFTGSDSDISIQTKVEVSEDNLVIKKTGKIVIEARYITEIVRKIESDIIYVELVDNYLTRISGGSSTFNINGMDALDYPAIDFKEPTNKMDINSSLLQTMISQTSFAASDRELKPILTGVHFQFENNTLVSVATDSYRLARKEVQFDNSINFSITIPSKSLHEVLKTIEYEETVMFAVDNNKAQFILGNTLIQTRLLDGTYPDTDRLIPQEFCSTMAIDARDIISSIDRVSFIKSEGISIVRFHLTKEECSISTKSPEVGYSHEILKSATYSGQDLDISCNGKYVSDALKALGAQNVEFKFVGDMKPFIIVSDGQSDCIQLVLPVKTYN